ncbi:MAG: monovalent cation/H(+) antiporter subunit G [Caldilinea sp.]|nr:monovalent cation/H(+) antiporter subunit G [Caldilinea sp.]
MTLGEISIVLLSAFGVFFMLVSAIGIVRLPDVFSRMHAGGKASTVGISAMLLAAGFYFFDEFLFYRMLLLIALLFATLPIATSAMSRAAYLTGPIKRKHLNHDDMANDISRKQPTR